MINVYGSKTTDLSTFMRSQDTFAYVKDQSLVPQNHGCGERKQNYNKSWVRVPGVHFVS